MVAGIPVGTSLIDAHAGGVGVMESVPASDSDSKGGYDVFKCIILCSCTLVTECKLTCFIFVYMLGFQRMMWKLYAVAWCWYVAPLLAIWLYLGASCSFQASGVHFGQVHFWI